jgi:hypothetical protein
MNEISSALRSFKAAAGAAAPASPGGKRRRRRSGMFLVRQSNRI